MSTPPLTSNTEPQTIGPDPLKRLSLAVKELNRLINRAKHLGELAEQPLPQPPHLQSSDTPSTGAISVPKK